MPTLLPDADAGSFELLDRPISDAPTHFELLAGDLAKDSHVAYRSDGSVLSDDPEHFAIVSAADRYRFTEDGQTVHVNGNPIPDADPATFQILHGAYAHDHRRVFYFTDQIVDADLSFFRPLDGPYASDSAHVYWMGKTIDGADPNDLPSAQCRLRVLSRQPARLLPPDRHRQCRPADVPARPGRHQLH